MTRTNPAANGMAVWLAAGAIAAFAFAASAAQAQSPAPSPKSVSAKEKRYYDNRGRLYYGSSGPNVSYQQGNTRVYITKRSWLDAGTEVLPGERKFSDYAFPPEIGYPSFARENKNRPIDRQPLSTPSDLGGYPTGFPLY